MPWHIYVIYVVAPGPILVLNKQPVAQAPVRGSCHWIGNRYVEFILYSYLQSRCARPACVQGQGWLLGQAAVALSSTGGRMKGLGA